MQITKIDITTPKCNIKHNNNNNINDNSITFTSSQQSGVLTKIKHSALVGMFLLPTLGIVSSCSDSVKKDSQGVEYVDEKADLSDRSEFVDSSTTVTHTVQEKETVYGISKQYNVNIELLKSRNGIGEDNNIKIGQVLIIPTDVNVRNIKTASDVSKVTGLSIDYIKELEKIENPNNVKTIYYDNNGNPNVGAGHKVLKSELSKYAGREISDEEKYTLLTKDLLAKEDKIKDILKPNVYDNLPALLRENVFDFAYHRGESAFKKNKPLVEGLNEQNYSKAVANLYKNYTMAKNSKGKSYEKHMAGLCKRSLIRMGNASKIFKGDIPDEVIKSAKSTYDEGLRLLKKEMEEGKISKTAYPNVLAEYQDIAYNLFDGKIGVKTGASKMSSTNIPEESSSEVINNKPIAPAPGNTPVYVNGQKISRSKQQIEADWANNAKRFERPFKRPELVLDKNGNVTAFVKVYEPKGRGKLNNKVIIVNQGHGGCCAHGSELNEINNTNFDPGCSNAVMEPVREKNGKFKRKKGELVLRESNKFIGNGGKALEEWKVNELFSNNLIDKLTSSGAKVIFISGEVHNAQNAIRKIEKENKVHCFISLHSNSSETIKTKVGRDGKEYISERITKRGFFIMPNNRNGIDVQDTILAKAINRNFHEDSWLVGLGDVKPKSLGVLSSSSKTTSPVPGVLIETGNLKHEKDVANLNSSDFRNRLIQATYEGIVEYLTK